jgi:GNAT superfamily N-acetyltransferase
MASFLMDGKQPVLVGVYVAPDYRGDRFGVTSALMNAIEDWATQYAPTITLEVVDANARARASYVKRGYVETGNSQPYPLDETLTELEMVKQLR